MKPRRRKRNKSAGRLEILIGVLALILAVALVVAFQMSQKPQDPTLSTTAPTETEPQPTQTEPKPTEPIQTGWVELDGKRYYYGEDGVLRTGVQTIDGAIYCFGSDGAQLGEGWQDVGDDRYYITAGGTAHVGWLELEEERYYLRTDGTMARGTVEIEGVKWFFTSAGCQVYLVNPWNYVPEGYEADLIPLSTNISSTSDSGAVDASCYEALMKMMNDCAKAGYKVCILSSHRLHTYQEKLFENQVKKQMDKGYSRQEAEVIAATISAIPGTSEHQLGLAVDIIDTGIWGLVEEQETLPGQQWLMEHCHEYGFILRYPKGKTDETGIIYEPWHYRYVGVALATELHQLDMTLEAYISSLSETVI